MFDFSVLNYTLAKASQSRHFRKTNEPNIHSNYWRVVVGASTAMPSVLQGATG